ncbi:hypothetical protein LWI29_012318 [Acer saccharum]|uniref:DUF4219 domain-containing protein n=1 Tax=Acer saccharum TaxID=4024 RepID=A0AA39T665_ACESA|nr:hypothetical protein LWI29_012318 [Acer saccharum]
MEEPKESNFMIRLTSSNYAIWKSRMEDYLCWHELDDTILGANSKPKDMDDEKWKKLNKRACAKIKQWVDNNVYNHVANETDAYKLWTSLKETYELNNAQNQAFIFRKLMMMRYKDGTPMAEHLNYF